MPANVIDFILGEWVMRAGDRLPMLGLILETDTGDPIDLTGAQCTLLLRHQDGGDALTIEHPGINSIDNWLHLPAYVYNGPAGIVVYDWPQIETESLRVGVMELMVQALWPTTYKQVTVPTRRDARLIVRPTAWRNAPAPASWWDTDFTAVNAPGDPYSTVGVWNTSTPGQITGP